jgi:hypothetical protein
VGLLVFFPRGVDAVKNIEWIHSREDEEDVIPNAPNHYDIEILETTIGGPDG